ncbi:MAG: OmpH family outer membrane protein [Opitutales bacterium]
MMKKSLLFFSLFVALSATLAAQSSPRMITVDMGRLFSEYFKVKDAEAKFQSSVETANQEIQSNVQTLEEMVQSFQNLQARAGNATLSEEARNQAAERAGGMQQEIVAERQRINQFQQQTNNRLAQRRQAIINVHMQEIADVVSQYARDQGADLVLNTTGNFVVYANTSFDKTDAVLDILNADAPNP